MDDRFSLDGKVAVITGGARTLGYDMAEVLGEAGADLVITSRSAASAERAAASLSQRQGVEVLPLAMDVTDYRQVEQVASRAAAWRGQVDILVNNAGGAASGASGGPRDFLTRRVEDMEAVIRVNLLGTLYCCRLFAPIMAEQGSGVIINIASVAGMVGRDRRMYHESGLPEQPVDYAVAKGGVISLTIDLAAALGPHGIRVNAISPGGFERGQPQEFVRRYGDRTALGRMGRDGVDLKGAVLFLASDASAYVTGHNLVVDGGFVVWH